MFVNACTSHSSWLPWHMLCILLPLTPWRMLCISLPLPSTPWRCSSTRCCYSRSPSTRLMSFSTIDDALVPPRYLRCRDLCGACYASCLPPTLWHISSETMLQLTLNFDAVVLLASSTRCCTASSVLHLSFVSKPLGVPLPRCCAPQSCSSGWLTTDNVLLPVSVSEAAGTRRLHEMLHNCAVLLCWRRSCFETSWSKTEYLLIPTLNLLDGQHDVSQINYLPTYQQHTFQLIQHSVLPR